MNIEVVVPESATSKERGDLLERFAQEFMQTQGFTVETEVRLTATELDLLCKHKINGRTVYVECKAYRENLSVIPLRTLLGTIEFKSYEEGWLISTGALGKDAKGFQVEWEGRSTGTRQKLSIYTPERTIECFIAAGMISDHPSEDIIKILYPDMVTGDWILIVSPYGRYWLAPVLESGVPSSVIIYEGKGGKQVTDKELLKRLSNTDCSLRTLDFEKYSNSTTPLIKSPVAPSIDKIIEVAHGESWTDYRPARPKDFVGRSDQINAIIQLFNDIKNGSTNTRVFAVTGDSGMGKSSLIAKLREKTKNKRNRSSYFVYALDARSARSPKYILLSLVGALQSAAEHGFGDINPEGIIVSDYSDPLSSPSVVTFLESLRMRNQVVCLIFDQFEELYSKPDLFEIFEEAQRLFLSAVSAVSNLVLGFAWRTDSTVPQDHPAYYMWHKLSDHRIEIQLSPFTSTESAHAVTLFEKELGQPLHPELRRQILENSQGYPWFLKKLCIHIYNLVSNGSKQSELRETLDAASLFDRDLQQLTQPQQACLRTIAGSAPADWYEILESFGTEVLRALQDSRLVVRSGDRINVYWDIFRDYILTRRIPSIPFTYMPSSPSIDALLRVATQLKHDAEISLTQLADSSTLSEKTARNVVRDLKLFSIAIGDTSALSLDPSIQSGETKFILEKIRKVLHRHALTLKLNKHEQGSIITIDEIAHELKRLNPSAAHRPKTWRFYADKIAFWLTAVGYLNALGNERWCCQDSGSVTYPLRESRPKNPTIFLGDAYPIAVIECLNWFKNITPPKHSQIKSAGHKNALRVLLHLDIIRRSETGHTYKLHNPDTLEVTKLLFQAAQKDICIERVVEYLQQNPKSSGQEIGNFVATTFKRKWAHSSEMRTGNALRLWAIWITNGGILPDTRAITCDQHERQTLKHSHRPTKYQRFTEEEVRAIEIHFKDDDPVLSFFRGRANGLTANEIMHSLSLNPIKFGAISRRFRRGLAKLFQNTNNA